MPRIILSLALITITGSALAFGVTRAFFSDTEASTGNTFTAGAIDLTIDNESYYNGSFNTNTSWSVRDLTIEKFFDFDDVKPDDYGEDTISLHVATNDAYLCADVTLTSNNENGQNEPEALVDTTVGATEGELAGLMNFLWWADDGDNVLEDDENVISRGPIGALAIGESYPIPLADADENIWTGQGGPVPGNSTQYIGKAWCFGTIAPLPVAHDAGDAGRSPAGDNNDNDVDGEPEDGGVTCDGSALGNESQTDSLTADIQFEAVQSRHNTTFQCEAPVRTKLTLVKEVIEYGPFDDAPTAWTLAADGVTDISGTTGNAAVTNAAVAPGVYNLSELGPQGYTASNWSCVGGTQNDGDTVTIAEGDSVTCTITNFRACEAPTFAYADSVVSFDQGVLKNGGAVAANRSNASKALGAPQSLGTPFDNPAPIGEFFSLGFDEGTDSTPNEGGKIVVEFTNNYIVDGPGNDLRLWEITGGTTYPTEKIKIEVSQDGSTWVTVASSLDRDAEADLAASGLTWARYVRLTDVSVRSEFEPAADGYDLDAFSALNCAMVTPAQ